MIGVWSATEPWPDDCHELLLVGPPGTGKTRTVLEHYVWPILELDGEVLATSYTRAAAMELRERTGARWGQPPETWRQALTTLHSEAWRRCAGEGWISEKRVSQRDDVDEEGPEEAHALIARLAEDEDESALKAWEATRQMWPEDIGRPIGERLARLLTGPALDVAVATVRHDRDGRYDDEGHLQRPDYTDVLEVAIARGATRHVALLAIDEAQDLTPLQWMLVDRWAANAARVLVVGDPDQAIYGWAGADGRRLLRWLRAGRPARRLWQSWRVPARQHQWARDVIGEVTDREDAPYAPADRPGVIEHVRGRVTWRETREAQARGESVLVLSRSRAGCAGAVDGLTEAGIPHIAERGRRVLGESQARPSKAVKIVRALDAIASSRGRPHVGDLRALVGALSTRGPLLAGQRGLKSGVQTAMKGIDGLIGRDQMARWGLPLERIAAAWGDAYDWDWGADLLEKQVSVGDLLQIQDWCAVHGGLGRVFSLADRVRVTTCHGSKGREAPLVVLDARAGSRAWRQSGTTAERDEDRRLLYVAITRSKERLVVVRGDDDRGDWIDQVGVPMR